MMSPENLDDWGIKPLGSCQRNLNRYKSAFIRVYPCPIPIKSNANCSISAPIVTLARQEAGMAARP